MCSTHLSFVSDIICRVAADFEYKDEPVVVSGKLVTRYVSQVMWAVAVLIMPRIIAVDQVWISLARGYCTM